MNRAIVTGAAGFTGLSLVNALHEHEYEVFAIVRPDSKNNERLRNLTGIHVLEIDLGKNYKLKQLIPDRCDVAFHLACVGERYDFEAQYKNVDITLKFLDELRDISCKRIVITGSQAEYGATTEIITEDMAPNPFCPYGAAKVATCFLSRAMAHNLNIEWVWARIFSLYGLNEPVTRMLPKLVLAAKEGKSIELSSCRQNWDYLNVKDAAEALIALGEKGKSGEIYNVANGDYKQLKEYVEAVMDYYGRMDLVTFGDDPVPFVSLQPDITKIKKDTGWEPNIRFEDGIKDL